MLDGQKAILRRNLRVTNVFHDEIWWIESGTSCLVKGNGHVGGYMAEFEEPQKCWMHLREDEVEIVG